MAEKTALNIKKGPSLCLILLGYGLRVTGYRLAARMLGVVDVALHFPEVLGHRAAAARGVLLGLEGDLVRGDLGEVFATFCYSGRDSCETLANVQFETRRHRASFHRLADEQAVTVGVGGCSGAVRTKEHMLAAVLRVRTRFS